MAVKRRRSANGRGRGVVPLRLVAGGAVLAEDRSRVISSVSRALADITGMLGSFGLGIGLAQLASPAFSQFPLQPRELLEEGSHLRFIECDLVKVATKGGQGVAGLGELLGRGFGFTHGCSRSDVQGGDQE